MVRAEIHGTDTSTVTKDFRYDPVPGAGNGHKALLLAHQWVQDMERDLGYDPPSPPPRAPRPAVTAAVFAISCAPLIYGVYAGWSLAESETFCHDLLRMLFPFF